MPNAGTDTGVINRLTTGWAAQFKVPIPQTLESCGLAITSQSTGLTVFGPTLGLAAADAGGFHIINFPSTGALPVGSYTYTFTASVGGQAQVASGTLTLFLPGTLPQPRLNSVTTFVAWHLQRLPADLDPSLLASEYAFVSAEFTSRYPCTAGVLSAGDILFFDRAAALVIAARLYGPLVTGQFGGNVLSLKTADGTAETYQAPILLQAEAWLKEAETSLHRVSCLSASLTRAAAEYSVFHLSGRRRAGGVLGGYLPAANLLPGDNRSIGYLGSTGLQGEWGMGLLDYSAYPLGGWGY